VEQVQRKRLINERKKLNKTRKDVAKDLNISEVYVRKLEAGASKPGRKTLIAFEKYYGVSMRELFPDIFLPHGDTECIKAFNNDVRTGTDS
jgi:putative transcriptional regulator